MKLVVAGASGFVATEIIRQCLESPKIFRVIALARRPVPAPPNLSSAADPSKLRSVVVVDYDVYSDEAKAQLAGIDACIWTVALTPTKARGLEFEQVRRVCHDYTLIGLEALFAAYKEGRNGNTQPFRFLYMSGFGSERDQTKTPSWEPRYCLMRGEVENKILAFAAEHKDEVRVCVAKPGFITASGQYMQTALATVLKYIMSLPSVDVKECSAAMLQEVVEGITKDLLSNEDLVETGRQELGRAGI